MKNKNLRSLIFASILVAIGIVLTSILSITYPPQSAIIRFGIGYLPLIIISIILGPKIGFYSALAQDILGYFVYMLIYGTVSGPFFPGFTFNAVLYGVIPALVYNFKFKKINIFIYINLFVMLVLLGIGIWSLFNLDFIKAQFDSHLHSGDSYSMFFVYLMIILGILGAISIFVFILFKRKENDEAHRIIFIVISLQLLVSIILTPIWVYYLYKAPIIAQMPLRIFKTPAEIFIYSILLIQIIKILNAYKLKESNF